MNAWGRRPNCGFLWRVFPAVKLAASPCQISSTHEPKNTAVGSLNIACAQRSEGQWVILNLLSSSSCGDRPRKSQLAAVLLQYHSLLHLHHFFIQHLGHCNLLGFTPHRAYNNELPIAIAKVWLPLLQISYFEQLTKWLDHLTKLNYLYVVSV